MWFKVPNNVNFLLTELSGAHCQSPAQAQEQLLVEYLVVERSFLWGSDTISFLLI